MRTASKTILWIAGILLVILSALQALAIYGVVTNSPTLPEKQPWLLPVWIGIPVVYVAAIVLFAVLAERDRLPLLAVAMAAAGAVAAVIVAMSLQNEFPVRIASSGADRGLSVWKLICRHYSVSLVGVLIAAAALLQLPVNAAARRRRDMGGETTRYDLGGKPLFRDSGSTIGLTEFAGGEAGAGLPRREKRSVRRAREKEERKRPE